MKRLASNSIRAFQTNEGGNFGVFAALTIPLFIAAGSLAVDTTNAISMKMRLQNAADAAALATSSRLANGDLAEANAKAYAVQFFDGMVSEDVDAYSGFSATPSVAVNGTPDATGRTVWEVSVTVSGSQELTPMARMIGEDHISIAVKGTSQSAPPTQSAFSMVLVLDKSGSMAWYGDDPYDPSNGQPKKIDALKSAVGSLAAQIAKADPNKTFSRLGAASYDDSLDRTQSIDWGTEKVTTFANKLYANGGTASTGAFKWAYDRLRYTTEDDAHEAKNGLKPEKFIVFMTDGDNNNYSDDYYTSYYCTQAKKRGIVVYSVAFMAPTKGQNLLKGCATDTEHYFDASNSEELVRAFQNIGLNAAKMISRLVE